MRSLAPERCPLSAVTNLLIVFGFRDAMKTGEPSKVSLSLALSLAISFSLSFSLPLSPSCSLSVVQGAPPLQLKCVACSCARITFRRLRYQRVPDCVAIVLADFRSVFQLCNLSKYETPVAEHCNAAVWCFPSQREGDWSSPDPFRNSSANTGNL